MNSTENLTLDVLINDSDQQIELREGYAEVNGVTVALRRGR